MAKFEVLKAEWAAHADQVGERLDRQILQSKLLHHSDRGSQYTSEPCQWLMAEQGIQCSLSRSGNVRDSAAMESSVSTLKTERTAGKVHRSRDVARANIVDDIEPFYNPRCRHSTLGYLSQIAFEERG